MSHLSKRVLDKKIEEQLDRSLIYLVKSLQDYKEVKSFLATAFTETEKKMIAKRVVAAFLLAHKVNQTEVCNLLKITPETVQRLKLRMQIDKFDFDLVSKKLERLKNIEELKDFIEPIVSYAIKAAAGLTPNPFYSKPRRKDKSIY
jgi:hypothetical protein